LIGRNAKGACEKVIDFPLERAFGLIKKEGDEDRESELALAVDLVRCCSTKLGS